MRKVIIAVATALLLGAIAPVYAMNVGGVAKNPGPVQPAFGTFKAYVKYIYPHYGPDGRYYTYSYLELTGSTMAYCQQQLTAVLANGNVTVIDWCHQVN